MYMFAKFIYDEYIRPYVLSHVVSMIMCYTPISGQIPCICICIADAKVHL